MIFTLPEIGWNPAEPISGEGRITGTPARLNPAPGCNRPFGFRSSADLGVYSLLDCPGSGPGSFSGIYGEFVPITVRADTICEGD